MQHRTLHFISPNFTYDKLEPPFFKDIVDVFEDRMLHWLILPAKELLKTCHGEVAAIALATSYMEAIEIYLSGLDSKGRSREFFVRGFKAVFARNTGPDFMHDALASALYELMRCGFAHEGIFRDGIYFSKTRPEAFLITWPKKAGELDPKGKLQSAVINPQRFVDGIEAHFDSYIRDLRRMPRSPLHERFKAAVDLKWHIGGRERIIELTEDEFYRGA
ncbi:hypothetical protein [Comamonas sediminis]|uniref:Uncharacterized protein n=1 Tax=Comamonas sediminis TaxID=1783360 RepID=A0ABV4B1L5_9BURK